MADKREDKCSYLARHDENNASGEETQDLVTLKVENIMIICNRQMLSKSSDYFNAMFQSQMKESNAEVVELKEVDATSMRNMVNFLKTGKYCSPLTPENIESVTQAACMYQVKDMIDYCCNHMECSLEDSNCLTYLLLADTFSLVKIYNKSRRHFVWFFRQVVKTDNFLQFDRKDILFDLMNDKCLNVQSELKVYDALERWVMYKERERTPHIPDLIKCVHVEDLTFDQKQELKMRKMVKSCPQCLDMDKIIEIKSIKQKYREMKQMLFILGGDKYRKRTPAEDERYDYEPHQNILKYDTEQGQFDTSNPFSDLQDVHNEAGLDMGYSVYVDGKDIYISGGEVHRGRNSWCMKVWRLDTFEHTWDVVAEMQTPRRHHATCVVGNSLYFVGGFGRFRVKLDTVEKFDLGHETWNKVAPLPEPAFSLGLCACKDKIYAVKEKIHCYNPNSDIWTTIISDSCHRFVTVSAVVHSNMFYCVSLFSNKLLCYDIETNEFKKIGNFKCEESRCLDSVVYRGRILRAAAAENGFVHVEWYEPISKTFGEEKLKLNDLVLSNFHLLSVPLISDYR